MEFLNSQLGGMGTGLSLEPGSPNLYSSSAVTCYMTLGEFSSTFLRSLKVRWHLPLLGHA